MITKKKSSYRNLQKAIGYKFRKYELLEASLTHRSYRFENDDVVADNQRMEFLGDAVLGFCAAAALYDRHPDDDEGILTTFRSQMTNGKALAGIAKAVNLGDYLRIGKGEENSGGRERSSNLEDALEAVLGAVYIDGGIKGVQKVFNMIFVPYLENLSGDVWAENPKGKLQEFCQRELKCSPKYRIIKKDGPPHETIFTVEVLIEDESYGQGVGTNKQIAEAESALAALKKLANREKGSLPKSKLK